MLLVLEPSHCQKCGAGLSVRRYRPPRWRPGAVIVFGVGCTISGVLLLAAIPFSDVVAVLIVIVLGYKPPPGGTLEHVHWLEAVRAVRWVAFAVMFVVFMVPAYLCVRTARRMARWVHLECPECGWRGEGLQSQQERPRKRDVDKEATEV